MRRRIIEGFVIALSVATLSISCAAKESKPGGYEPVSVSSNEVVAAATFAVEAQQQVIGQQSGGASAGLELIDIQAAEQQVVSGINYRLKLKVRHDGKERTAEAVVWWQAWRKPDPYLLTSWRWE